jgi:hypothetical protein
MKKKKIIHFLRYMFMPPAAADVQGFPRPFKAIKAYPRVFGKKILFSLRHRQPVLPKKGR